MAYMRKIGDLVMSSADICRTALSARKKQLYKKMNVLGLLGEGKKLCEILAGEWKRPS